MRPHAENSLNPALSGRACGTPRSVTNGHDHQHAHQADPGATGASAVRKFHTHSIPLDMEDIERDWDKPVTEAGIAAKASVIVRVGMLDLSAGTGSFRVREMMHRIAYPLGVHVRADVNLTDIEAACTDGRDRITEVVDLPTTGVNTERIWLLEHFADWFNVNLGTGSMYHAKSEISEELVEHLDSPDAKASIMRAVEKDRAIKRAQVERLAKEAAEAAHESTRHGHKPPKGEYAEHFDYVTIRHGGQVDGDAASASPAADAAGTDAAAGADGTPNAVTGGGITVRQAHERLDLIERRKPLYAPWFSGLASALACAAFVFLLGGGIYDMVGAFIGAGLGQWLRRRLFAHHLNQFFVTFVCVAVAALACTGVLRAIGWFVDPVALEHDTAYIGAMLFVIPGFPLITGGLDMAKIDFPSGIQRICYVLCIILMATLAGWGVALIVHLNPEGFEPLGLDPTVNCLLRFVAAFIGVWGFSVLFNSPQRMCLVAAFIGAITDTFRLEIVDMGVPAEGGAFLGALLAGLLASTWRSSVRRGWLPPHLGYPRICLTVPSIVIMVPGMYMYQAMFHLGQFDTQLALDWAFRAFMVIVCLPIGLAMARVITDKSWRYDI